MKGEGFGSCAEMQRCCGAPVAIAVGGENEHLHGWGCAVGGVQGGGQLGQCTPQLHSSMIANPNPATR